MAEERVVVYLLSTGCSFWTKSFMFGIVLSMFRL